MTAFDRFDARMPSALDDLASPQFPEYFDDVLDVAMAHRQRPAWTFPERWIPMSTLARRPTFAPAVPWRIIAIALLLLALAVAGAIISFGLRPDPLPAPFGPAANGLIAYPAHGDIYTRDLATGEEHLVIVGPETDAGPTFSRDGQWIAFIRFESAAAQAARLMVARADGSDERVLTDLAEPFSMSWSPTSDSIAFISAPVGEERNLSIVSIDSDVEPVTISMPVIPQGTVEWRPPAGNELIFEARDRFFHAIYGVHPDGSAFRQITIKAGDSDYWGPYEFTPDGSQMFFTDGAPAVTVGVLDLETGEVRPFGRALPEPEDWDGRQQFSGSASILPDGKTIVFGRYWNGDAVEINHQLWTAPVAGDGAGAVPIGPVHRSAGGTNPFWQAVAPDGRSILVVENDTQLTWLADPEGGTTRPINLPTLHDPPTWQRVAP
jgi:WD40 repeat protein